ncbi:hypothetical protein NKI19_02285 [Mesorhizobium sp. M0751]|uniref:hypothetical protein n=1 Tax=unclassified Mesorhizobium TaxID=325217 RepID=UPI00333CEF20
MKIVENKQPVFRPFVGHNAIAEIEAAPTEPPDSQGLRLLLKEIDVAYDPGLFAKRLEDLITARYLIMPGHLEREHELLTKKWFDYRFLSPLDATLLFGEIYRKALRAFVRANIDRELSEHVNGVKAAPPSEPAGWFTQLWMARQRADELGLPYDEFMEFSFHFSGRRTRSRNPLPLQLHANDTTKVAWHAQFEKFKLDRGLFSVWPGSDLAQYQIDHYRGLPAQKNFREVLTAVLRTDGKRWSDVIARHCLSRRQLPLRAVLRIMPGNQRRNSFETAVDEMRIGMWGTRNVVKLDDAEFLQSCFGMQNPSTEDSVQCCACPDHIRCRLIATKIDELAKRRFGSASPVRDARLAAVAARVAKHRAKMAALARTGGHT